MATKRGPAVVRPAEVLAGVVHIDDPHEGDTRGPTIPVNGSGSPNGSTVIGVLTNTTTNATFQSDSSATISLGAWSLQFSNVQPGTYILAVNQITGGDGADAIHLTVQAGNVLTVEDPTFIGGGTTAKFVGDCDPSTHISGVIAASKPDHGSPRKQNGNARYRIDFPGLTRGRTYTVNIYPIRHVAKAVQKTFTVP